MNNEKEEKSYPPYLDRPKKIVSAEKELNLLKLLKGCEGEKIYSLILGECTVEELEDGIVVRDRTNHTTDFYIDGTLFCYEECCLLFPSRVLYEKYPLDAYTAWMEWKEARKPKRWRATKGEEFWQLDEAFRPYRDIELNVTIDNLHYESGNYFRTEKEALQAAEIVKEALQKFHEKKMNKTWKKK